MKALALALALLIAAATHLPAAAGDWVDSPSRTAYILVLDNLAWDAR